MEMNVFSFGLSFNQSSSSCYNEWIIVSREYHHMDKDRYIFSSLNECNTKQIFVGDDRYLSVVGFPAICYQSIKLLIQVKGKLGCLHLTKL